MKKCNYLCLLLFIGSFLYLSSCKKEEDTIDLRDDIIGTYDYRVKFYETKQGIGYLGTNQDNFGVMVATKKEGDKIEFKVGKEIIFTTSKFKARQTFYALQAFQDGITFDLADDSDYIEGQNVKIVGDYRVEFDGVNYQGLYYPNSKQLKMAQTVSYSTSSFSATDTFPVTVVAILEAKKR